MLSAPFVSGAPHLLQHLLQHLLHPRSTHRTRHLERRATAGVLRLGYGPNVGERPRGLGP